MTRKENAKRKLQLKSPAVRKAAVILCFLAICAAVIGCSGKAFEYRTDRPDKMKYYGLTSGETLTQELPRTEGTLSGVSVAFVTYERTNHGVLTLTLLEDGRPIRVCREDTSFIADNVYHDFYFNRQVRLNPERLYSITLTDEYEGENATAVWLSVSGDGLSYSAEDLTGFTLCSRMILVNEKLRIPAAALLLAVLLILFVYWFRHTDPRNIRLGKMAVVTAAVMILAEGIGVDLFRSTVREISIRGYSKTQDRVALEPGEQKDFAISTSYTDFSRLNFFVTSGNAEELQIRLVNKDSGTVFMDRTPEAEELIQDPLSDKNAVSLQAEKCGVNRFPRGNYTLTLTNRSGKKAETEIRRDTLNHVLILNSWLTRVTAYLVLMIIIIITAAVFLGSRKGLIPAEKFFRICALPLYLSSMLLFQPWGAPDTGDHYRAAYRISNYLLLQTENNGWTMRADDLDFDREVWRNASKNGSAQSAAGIAYRWETVVRNETMVQYKDPPEKMTFYSSLCYLPEAAGFALARILRLGTVPMLCLGRLMMLATYLLICRRAVHITPVGKTVFAGAALLPIGLMMSSAISYDGKAIAVSFAFTAAVLRLCRKGGTDSKRYALEAAAWTFLLGGIKGGGYLMLLPLVLIPISLKDRKSLVSTVPVLAAGVVSLLLFDVILPAGQSLFQFGGDEIGKLSASWGLTHPLEYLDLWVRSIIHYTNSMTLGMGGSELGWAEATIKEVYIALITILIGVLSAFEQDELNLRTRDRNIFLGTLTLFYLAVPLMLLSHNNLDSTVIRGLQGRYFLPALPLILMTLTKFRVSRTLDPVKGDAEAVTIRCQRLMTVLMSVSVYYIARVYLTR